MNRKLINGVLATSLSLFAACSSGSETAKTDETPTETTTTEEVATSPAQAVIEGHAAWSTGDWDTTATLFADDVEWTPLASKLPAASGLDALKAVWTQQRTSFPDATAKPAVIYQGDGVTVVEGVFTGTNSGPMASPQGEMPATNKPVGTHYVHIYWWNADGKISKVHALTNEAAQMMQLGVIPASKEMPTPALATLPAETKIIEGAGNHSTDVVATSMAAWVNWDEAALQGAMADGFKQVNYGDGGTVLEGWDAFAAHDKMFRAAFTEINYTIGESWAIGPAVIATGTFGAKNTGDMGAMKATNNSFSTASIDIFWMSDDGKIQEIHSYANGMDMMGQLMPAPPAQAAK